MHFLISWLLPPPLPLQNPHFSYYLFVSLARTLFPSTVTPPLRFIMAFHTDIFFPLLFYPRVSLRILSLLVSAKAYRPSSPCTIIRLLSLLREHCASLPYTLNRLPTVRRRHSMHNTFFSKLNRETSFKLAPPQERIDMKPREYLRAH